MIKIIETPRDAMQGIAEFIPTKKKIEYINSLFKIGFSIIDIGSFVSPKAIPQLADTEEVLHSLDKSDSTTKTMVTIGNLRGAQKAMEFDTIDFVAYPYSVSDTFLKLNINTSKQKAIESIENIVELCDKFGKELILYNAMAFGNAYGDEWNLEIIYKNTLELEKLGVKCVVLSDTIALANKSLIEATFDAVISDFPNIEFGAHLHTSEQNWRENVQAAWDSGCRRFDAVINGRGGCPMSKHVMVGNLPTTNLISFLNEIGQQPLLDMAAFSQSLTLANGIFPEA